MYREIDTCPVYREIDIMPSVQGDRYITFLVKYTCSKLLRQRRLEPVVILRNRHMTIAHRAIFVYAISA